MDKVTSSFLVVMDVEVLYTNIDHEEGLQALSHDLNKRRAGNMPPNSCILKLTEWTLKNNVLHFQDDLYQQQKGTAIHGPKGRTLSILPP